MSGWIQLPPPPLLWSKAVPYLAEYHHLDQVRQHFVGVSANWVEADLPNLNQVSDLVAALKEVLPFPDWCGSNWDSIEDAFEEIRQGWNFPLILVLHGLQDLLGRHCHFGLETVVRLSALQDSFSLAGDQFVVIYAGSNWT